MLSKDVKGLYEAYAKVYDEENFDLITNELIEEVVEELVEECVEFGYDLDEAAELVEEAATEYLMELNPYAAAGSKEARAYQKSTTSTRRGEARKAAVKGAVERVKSKAKGVAAAAGIAGSIAKDEARRAGRTAKQAVVSTAQKTKEKVKSGVKGLLGKGLRAAAGAAGSVAQKARKAGAAAGRAAERLGESVDVFDYILEHLVAEGYADTNENALVIMANMSEEWREEILEGSYEDRIAANNKKYDRNRQRAAQRASARNAARDAGQTGSVPGVGYVTPRRERTTYTDAAGTERHHSGAKSK